MEIVRRSEMSQIPSNSQQDDGIEIRVIQNRDGKRVLEFIGKFFFRDEPLTTGSEPKDELMFGEDFILSNIPHGTCLMAVLKDTDELVGLTMAGPKGPDEADHLFEAAAKEGNTKWGRILKFSASVERDANVYKRYNVVKVLHITATCVDVKVRGRNIGARLYNSLNELGKQMGFELLTSDCTSYYSAIIKDRLGWDCVNITNYKDYVDENNKQVFQPDPIHESCKTYAIRL